MAKNLQFFGKKSAKFFRISILVILPITETILIRERELVKKIFYNVLFLGGGGRLEGILNVLHDIDVDLLLKI